MPSDVTVTNGSGIRRLRYFAYGSNMSIRQMSVRCPDSALGPATLLHNHQFRINQFGVATVIPSPGSVVHGVLWEISDRDLGNLDRYEGVPSFYVRESTFVEVKGELIPALIYLATDSTPGEPRSGYLEGIVAVARDHGLPVKYLEELDGWLGASIEA